MLALLFFYERGLEPQNERRTTMRKSTRAIAEEMGLQPISVWSALKMLLKGYRPGLCWGYRTKKVVRAWRTK
jgi:hypothetical protein